MSRIGNNPIAIPAGVEVKVDNNAVTVKGPKGELTQAYDLVSVEVKDAEILVTRKGETKEGVSKGFKTEQELVGVGYRASVSGQLLELNLGFSHTIFMQIPAEVKVTTESVKGQPPLVTFESVDKQLVGQVAAKLRSLRPPEPYKGKGIKFKGEQLRRKAGKTATK